jgi:hypothetical protein
MQGIATFTVTASLPVLLLVTGAELPPSNRVNVTVTFKYLPAETPLQIVLPVTLTVPGTCSEMCGFSEDSLQPSITMRSCISTGAGGGSAVAEACDVTIMIVMIPNKGLLIRAPGFEFRLDFHQSRETVIREPRCGELVLATKGVQARITQL